MKYILLSLFLFQSNILLATEKWQQIFGGVDDEKISKVISANGGGWITAGYTASYGDSGFNVHVIKWNADGKIVWQKVLGSNADDYGYACVQDAAGNIFVAGKTNSQGSAGGFDMLLMKLDSTGVVQWQQTYGGTADDYANSIVLEPNGDLVMCGGTRSSGAGGEDAWLVKVNSSGTSLWMRTYGSMGNEIPHSLISVFGGGYLLAGSSTSFFLNKGYVVRTDNLGDTVWTQTYDIGALAASAIYDVKQFADSNFIFTGYGGDFSYGNMFHMKTSQGGSLTYFRLSNYLADMGRAVVTTPDGGYTVAGIYSNYGNFPSLTKYDSTGTKEWEHVYRYNLNFTYNYFASGETMVLNSDGTYTLAGGSGIYDPCGSSANNENAFILKADCSGLSAPILLETITANTNTNFCDSANVNVTISAPPGYNTYQWFQDIGCTKRIIGASSQSYHVTEVGTYFCQLTSDDNIYFSNEINITVTFIPNAPTVSPSGIVNRCISAFPNDAVLNTPNVSGVSYQWLLNNVPVPGATNSNFYPQVDGMYSVTSYNTCDTATSAQVEVHVNQGPDNIIVTPNNYSVVCRANFQNAPISSSEKNGRYTYTWLLNNVPIPNMTSYNLNPAVSGNYSVVVSNGCGIDTSNSITIITDSNSVPVITLWNSGLTWFGITGTTYHCGSDTLQCAPALSGVVYEWRLNGNILQTTNSIHYATQPGNYTVKIIDSCGSSVTSQPYIVNAVPGNDTAIVTNNTGCTYAQLLAPFSPNSGSYQWYRNGVAFSIGNGINTTQGGNFYCTFQPAGCQSPIPTNTIAVLPSSGAPVINASPSANVCNGNISLTVTYSTGTYVWKRNGTVIPGANSQTYSASQTGIYSCIITRPGCGNDTAETGISIGTNQIYTDKPFVCPGSNNTMIRVYANESGSTLQWRRNGVDISGQTNNNIYVSQPGTYELSINGACGNYVTNSVILQSAPTALTPSGILSICNGNSITITAPAGAGYQYQWYLGNSLIQDSGAVLNYSGYNFNTNIGYINARITVPGVCTYYTDRDTIILKSILPNNIYSETTTEWCGSGSVQLNARTNSNFSYQWYKNSIAIPSATASGYVATSAGDYYVAVDDGNGCLNNSNAIKVKSNALPGSISLPGCGALCAGDTAGLTLNSAATTHQWFIDGDSIPGATSANCSALITGHYSVNYSNNSGCSGALSTEVSVAAFTSHVINSNGLNFCIGDTATLSIPYVAIQQWYFNGSPIAGQTNFQCKVAQSGNYSAISYSNGCPVYSDTVTLIFDSIPFAVITSGQTSLCSASSIMLSANHGLNLSYQWKKNGVDLPGETFLIYHANSSGTYTCEVTSNCGSAISNAIVITSPFNAGNSAGGATTFCSGGNVLLSATPTSGGYTYQWKNNNLNIPGATGATYLAATSGNYYVEISDANGCSNASSPIQVTVLSPTPSPQLTSSGYLCPGQSVTMSVDSSNIISYQWKFNGVNIAGATSSVYNANAIGIYTCVVTNTCGTGISDTIFIVTGTLPSIIPLVDTILCTGSSITLNPGWVQQSTYLWHDNSSSQTLTLTSLVPDSILAYVTVTNNQGCVDSDSALVLFEVCSGIASVNSNGTIVIYPNPAQDKLFVIHPDNKMTLKIFDMAGRILLFEAATDESTEINISNLAAGVYFIQIDNEIGSVIKKFIKE